MVYIGISLITASLDQHLCGENHKIFNVWYDNRFSLKLGVLWDMENFLSMKLQSSLSSLISFRVVMVPHKSVLLLEVQMHNKNIYFKLIIIRRIVRILSDKMWLKLQSKDFQGTCIHFEWFFLCFFFEKKFHNFQLGLTMKAET